MARPMAVHFLVAVLRDIHLKFHHIDPYFYNFN